MFTVRLAGNGHYQRNGFTVAVLALAMHIGSRVRPEDANDTVSSMRDCYATAVTTATGSHSVILKTVQYMNQVTSFHR